MKHLLMILIICLTVLMEPPLSHSSFADDSAKYQNLFYPNGMPLVAGQDNVMRPTIYHYLSESSVPNTDLSIILFSVERILGANLRTNHDIGEKEYAEYIAVVRNNLQILSEQIIAKQRPTIKDGGKVDNFNIATDLIGIHIYVWDIYIGSGGLTDGSDYFYKLDNITGMLTSCLTLDKTYFYLRSGSFETEENVTHVYFADIDNDGKMEVLTRDEAFENNKKAGIQDDSWADTINVYKYNFSTNQYEMSGQINQLPANAIELKK